MNNFAVSDISYYPTLTNLSIVIHTNKPRHLTCYYTDTAPRRHKTSRRERGIDLPWGAYFCFTSWKSIEQAEPGDTTTHTFLIPDWSFCQTKWFVFRGITYEYVPTPSGPVLPEDYPFYEPWGATLTQNYPWLPFIIPDIPEWTLDSGILTLTNPGFADCGIAYGPPWASLPLLDGQNQPLRINTDNPQCSINSSSTQVHHELIFRSLNEVMSIYLSIGLGAEWDYYKPFHHTRIRGRDCGIYWIGTGHHDLNLYDLFVKFRTLFGKSTDPTGWSLNDIVFVMSLGEEHRTDTLKSNFLGFYHPLPDSVTPVLSPSVSCIFQYHHPGPGPPLIEEQTQGIWLVHFAGGVLWDKIGQILYIPNRSVVGLSFYTKKVGNPPGTIAFTIRRASDDTILASKLYGTANSVPPGPSWIDVTFDVPVLINERVRILMEWTGPPGDTSNYLEFWGTLTDVKALEFVSRWYNLWGYWTNTPSWDAKYRYTYHPLF